MKLVLPAFVLACCVLTAAHAASDLSRFRQSYRGTAEFTGGRDSLSGTSSASFNASLHQERGTFLFGAAFHAQGETVFLPSSLRFRGRKVTLRIGSGESLIVGSGRATFTASMIRFSLPADFHGTPATVAGWVERSNRGLRVEETIRSEGRSQKLTFVLRSKRPPGADPRNVAYAAPRISHGVPGGAFAAAWTNSAAALVQYLAGAKPSVRIEVVTAVAYESGAVPARVRISRAGNRDDLAVTIDLGGDADSRHGSASPADYRLLDSGGRTLGSRIVIPDGVSSVDVTVMPVADGFHEVPETLSVALQASSTYQIDAAAKAAVVISDASLDAANDTIFLAYLAPGSGITSSASGVSAVHLRGDNSAAAVDLSFSGLTSAQSAAHIGTSVTGAGTGPDIQGLPRGQIVGANWTIAARQFFTTDQAVLDALYAGQLSVAVLSGDYPAGEIQGNYVISNGSMDPPVPTTPPVVGPLTGESLRRDVARFLMQATFGPNQADIDALAADVEGRGGDRIAGYASWIDQQFALPQTRLLDYVQAADAQEWNLRGTDPINYATGNEPGSENRRRGWWMLAIAANDQLRQRMAFALSEIFVISEATDGEVQDRQYGAANYYDLLGRDADGNYHALLGDVSRSPMMGKYLSSLKNQKAVVDSTGKVLASPDENYAREVMQLFSIGLVTLNADGSVKLGSSGGPTPTYSNADITELARVLTGWSFSKTNGSKAAGYPVQDNSNFYAGYGPRYFQASWLSPMKNFAAFHDTGAKVVLGATIPAGVNGDQDLDAALDILANHPNTAPFFARLLIQRLVESNPSAGYIYRVAKVFDDDGTGRRGNLKAVVKAILLDYEARDAAVALQVGHGKQKEPIIRYVQMVRAFGGASKLPLSDLSAFGYPSDQLGHFPAGTTAYRYPLTDNQLGQTPLRAPTVFNWFSPDYSPPGPLAAAGLVAPEMQLTNETQVTQTINYMRAFTESDTGQSVSPLYGATDPSLDDVRIDRSPQVNKYRGLIGAGTSVREAVTAVVDDLDLLLAGGRFKERYEPAVAPNPRSIIIDAATATSEGATSNDRVKAIAYLLGNSPTFLHQQ